MNLEETTLSFLKKDCKELFGTEEGEALYKRVQAKFVELLAENVSDNPILQEHFQRKLLPPLAYYLVLREHGFGEEPALTYVKKETHKAAAVKQEEMRKMAQLPFAYTIYRMGVKKQKKKNFPPEGWETRWVRCNGKEIHFDLCSCIYWETTQKYHCPELCTVYCENDQISFSGLLPKIRFERSGTLGEGASCCDFHFFKNASR